METATKSKPFKFLRKTPDEKQTEPTAASATMSGTALPASWFSPSRLLPGDPFRLLLDPLGGFTSMNRWFGDYSPGIFEPAIDVTDQGDAIRISAELPGLEKQDLQVLIDDGTLILKGEKKLESKTDEKGCYRVERAFGRFERVIPLFDGVDTKRAEATFDKGVLTVQLPTSDAAAKSGARQLEIK